MSHRPRIVLIAFGLAAATAIAGCSSSPTATPPSSAPTSTRLPPSTLPPPIVATDPSKPINAKLGQSFNIRVDIDPTREASWQVDSYDQAIVFFLGEGPDQSSATPGAPLTDLLTFRADKQGTTPVVLRYGAPGVGTPSDKRVTFNVTVT